MRGIVSPLIRIADEGGDDDDQVKRLEDDPLARTGRPFGGAIRDAKRRYKHYLSDFKDGLNMQVCMSFKPTLKICFLSDLNPYSTSPIYYSALPHSSLSTSLACLPPLLSVVSSLTKQTIGSASLRRSFRRACVASSSLSCLVSSVASLCPRDMTQ